MRAGAKGVGETMGGRGGSRDDYPTLRVTNLSEDARDDDLWDLFGRFGKINRCVFLSLVLSRAHPAPDRVASQESGVN